MDKVKVVVNQGKSEYMSTKNLKAKRNYDREVGQTKEMTYASLATSHQNGIVPLLLASSSCYTSPPHLHYCQPRPPATHSISSSDVSRIWNVTVTSTHGPLAAFRHAGDLPFAASTICSPRQIGRASCRERVF